jgi:hypothetical protein
MLKIYQAHGSTIAEQYLDVGKLFETTIKYAVLQLAKKRTNASLLRKKVAESAWLNLKTQKKAEAFVNCLVAWSKGAGIKPVEAMWLLADNLSGCQTMIMRYGSGVALLHTEEEFRDATHTEMHMTTPHTIVFHVGKKKLMTLVYNNLMPGCGLYGWKKNLIVAVDSLFVREDGIGDVKRSLLSNMISWMVWKMTPKQASPERIVALINSLGELVDGYAINVVRKVKGKIEGYKLILARNESKTEYLGEAVASYLCQTNIINPSYYEQMKWALPPKNIWRGGWKYFQNRIKTMDGHAHQYAQFARLSLGSKNIKSVHQAIQQKIFGDLRQDYISPDLGAVCVGLVDQAGTSVSCKLNDTKPLLELEYLDILV